MIYLTVMLIIATVCTAPPFSTKTNSKLIVASCLVIVIASSSLKPVNALQLVSYISGRNKQFLNNLFKSKLSEHKEIHTRITVKSKSKKYCHFRQLSMFTTIVKLFDTVVIKRTVTSESESGFRCPSVQLNWTSRCIIWAVYQKARGTKNRPFCDNIWYKLKTTSHRKVS